MALCMSKLGDFMARGKNMMTALMVGTATLSMVAAAVAPASAQAASANYQIASQPLGQALMQLSRQANVDIVAPARLTRGRTAGAVAAESVDAALRQMLAGTGLSYKANGRRYVIQAGSGSSAGAMQASPASNDGESKKSSSSGNSGSAPVAEPVDRPDQKSGSEEIVVTGSHIRGSAPAGANLIVLDRKDLDQAGRGTLAEAIQIVPQLHGGGRNDSSSRSGPGGAPNSFGDNGAYGAASLNLRGLGVEETLTLVNGRRLAPAGFYGAFADISGLPMAAVERVEILADGASATYGADAVAGVVNIIMDRRFKGVESTLRAGLETRSGQPELQANQTVGWAFDRGNVLIAADYFRRDGITAEGRPYAASADLREFGGSDHRLPYCNPGNIVSPAGLAGAIPAGQDGTSLTVDQILTGQTNQCDIYGTDSHLIPETKKGSLYLSSSYDISDRLRLSADLIGTVRHSKTIQYYHPLFFISVPVTNAYRQMNGLSGNDYPLNSTIVMNYLLTELDPITLNTGTRSFIGALNAEYHVGSDWFVSLGGSYGRYHDRTKTRSIDTRSAAAGGTVNSALASSDPATAFNPFGDGSTNSRSLVDSFLYDSHSIQDSSHRSLNIGLNGSVINLRGGPVKLAIGADFRREKLEFKSRLFYANLAPGFQERASTSGRSVSAVFGELFFPVFSERNAIPGARRLSLSLSGRYDQYSDFGSTFNPKAGVTWTPIRGLTFKGSYGTSFKAPLLPTLNGDVVAFNASYASVPGAPDLDGDGYVSILTIGGANPDLGPEEGKSWTLGLEIEPAAIPGLRFHSTYFNLRFDGRFAQAAVAERVIADPASYQGIAYFPHPSLSEIEQRLLSVDRVSGVIPPLETIEAILDSRTLNFAAQVMDGIDAGASYEMDVEDGIFQIDGQVSYLSRYSSRLGESVTKASYLNNIGLPARWKARAGLGWSGNRFSLNVWLNHVGSYRNKLVSSPERVDSYTTVDLTANAEVSDDISLSAYITNLFDEPPPFVDFSAGYDGANADPYGRRIAFQLTKRW